MAIKNKTGSTFTCHALISWINECTDQLIDTKWFRFTIYILILCCHSVLPVDLHSHDARCAAWRCVFVQCNYNLNEIHNCEWFACHFPAIVFIIWKFILYNDDVIASLQFSHCLPASQASTHRFHIYSLYARVLFVEEVRARLNKYVTHLWRRMWSLSICFLKTDIYHAFMRAHRSTMMDGRLNFYVQVVRQSTCSLFIERTHAE